MSPVGLLRLCSVIAVGFAIGCAGASLGGADEMEIELRRIQRPAESEMGRTASTRCIDIPGVIFAA